MKKGFTLIELLAVIVILAIIALIAVPIILNVIDNSKKESYKRSADGIVSALKITYSAREMKSSNKFIESTVKCDKVSCKDEENNIIEFNGQIPEGIIKITENSIDGYLIFDGVYIEINSGKVNFINEEQDTIIIYDGNKKYIIKVVNKKNVEVITPTSYEIYNNLNEGNTIKFISNDIEIENSNITGNIYIESTDGRVISFKDSIPTLKIPTDAACFTINNSGQITKYKCYEGNTETCNGVSPCPTVTDLVIPKSINGRDVLYTYYSYSPFSSKGLKSVDFSLCKELKAIGGFYSNQIEKIEFGNLENVTIICSSTFANNKIIGEIDLSGLTNLKNIEGNNSGRGSFYNNKNLTSIKFPPNVEKIGYNSFSNCGITGELDLSNTKISILENSAFNNNKITKLKLPNSLISIKSYAFSSNTIEEISFGDDSSLETIESSAFSGIKINGTLDLSNLTNLKSICSAAFSGGSGITGLKLPQNLETIGNSAFRSCKISGVLDLSNTKIKTIGESVFLENNLTKIILPSTIESIGRFAFCRATFNANSNLNLTTIVNKSSNSFDWAKTFGNSWTTYKGYDDEGQESASFVTGKVVTVKGDTYIVSE